MELKDIILEAAAIHNFIDTYTKPCSYDRIELFRDNHSLGSKNFNRELITSTIYTLCQLPVHNIYAYKPSSSDFCLYLLMETSNLFIDTLVQFLGLPANVPMEDVIQRDFDFLAWRINKL